MSNLNALAIIAARGGSKGVPRKNVRSLAGIPLIGYTIAAARGARRLTDVVVTTDDDEIASVALEFGARVPFKRSAELAGDTVAMEPVLQDCVQRLEAAGSVIDVVVLLPATNPFRVSADIDAGLALLEDSGADSVVAVVQEHYPAAWLQTFVDGRAVPLLGADADVARRQDAPATYKRNDGFFMCRRDVLMTHGTLLGADTRAYVMDQCSSIDIDSEWEFELADLVMRSPRGDRYRPAR